MEAKEAVKMKEKLNEILDIADEFGKQSAQLATSKASVVKLAKSVENTNELLVQMLEKCEHYLDSATEIMDGEYLAKIEVQIEQTRKITEDMKVNGIQLNQQLNDEISAYVNQVKSMEKNGLLLHEDVIALIEKGNAVHGLVESYHSFITSEIESMRTEVTSSIKVASVKLEKLTQSLESNIANTNNAMSGIESIVVTNTDRLSVEIKESMEALIPETQKTINEISRAMLKSTASLSDEIKDTDVRLLPILQAISNQLEQALATMSTIGETTHGKLHSNEELIVSCKDLLMDAKEQLAHIDEKGTEILAAHQTLASGNQNMSQELEQLRKQVADGETSVSARLQKLVLFGGISVGAVVILQIIALILR